MFKDNTNEGFLSYLVQKQIVSTQTKVKVSTALLSQKLGLAQTLLQLGLVHEKILAETLADYTQFDLLPDGFLPIDVGLPVGISTRFLRHSGVFPIEQGTASMKLAMQDPLDTSTQQMISAATGKRIVPCVVTQSHMNILLDHFVPEQEQISQHINSEKGHVTGAQKNQQKQEDEHSQANQLKDRAGEAPVVRLVDKIIDQAVLAKASDIHLELAGDRLEIRYRIDGILKLQDLALIGAPEAAISRIKIISGLDIAEKRLPQDGRARVVSGGREIDLRVAVMPTHVGESVTIRLLNKGDTPLDLPSLGFSEQTHNQLRQLLRNPHGLILVTGPTGSGKTTTLYAALQEKIDGRTKIISIEDPVEYDLEGVTQIPVMSSIGLDFPTVLRSVLRHDPDIILIGEIRDRETAEIAVQAALTGHLVLATLHTNSAAGSVTRLLDMGVADYLITASLRGVIAQRLVRRLAGSGDDQSYSGRAALSEILVLSPAIRQLVLSGADTLKIEEVAQSEGMTGLLEDGLEKVDAGITSLEEIYRIKLEKESDRVCAADGLENRMKGGSADDLTDDFVGNLAGGFGQ